MSDIKNEKQFYDWNEFNRDIKNGVARLSPYRGQIKNVFGIPRGGLIVATTLSHYLNVPLILDSKEISNNTLICDDIADTGETFIKLLESLDSNVKEPLTFSLHYNNRSKFKPTVWICKKKAWTVYPWETLKTSKYDNR